jgi:hypothetical protein
MLYQKKKILFLSHNDPNALQNIDCRKSLISANNLGNNKNVKGYLYNFDCL